MLLIVGAGVAVSMVRRRQTSKRRLRHELSFKLSPKLAQASSLTPQLSLKAQRSVVHMTASAGMGGFGSVGFPAYAHDGIACADETDEGPLPELLTPCGHIRLDIDIKREVVLEARLGSGAFGTVFAGERHTVA